MPSTRSLLNVTLILTLFTGLSLTACDPAATSFPEILGTPVSSADEEPSLTAPSGPANPPQTSGSGDGGGNPSPIDSWILRFQDDLPAMGHYVLPTSDGATLVLAWRDGAPWVLKVARDGTVLWQEMLAIFGLHSIIETDDGHYVFFGPYDFLSLDSEGQLLWQRSFGRGIDQLARIGVILSRITHIERDPSSGGWLIGDDFGLLSEIDPQGMLTNQTYYSGRPFYPDSLTHMSPASLSTAAQNNERSFFIEHYSLTDNNHWRRTLDFSFHDLPIREPYFLIGGDSQGGLLFGGPVYSYLIDGGVDLYLLKMDRFGEIEWERIIAGTTTLSDVNSYRMQDGGFLISATRWGYYAIEDDYLPYLWLIRLDSEGEVLWQRIIGDGTTTPRIHHAAENQDGDLLLTGSITPGESVSLTSDSDLLLIQLNADGQIPGCSWVRSIQHDFETPQTSSDLVTSQPITSEPADFTWTEENWDSPLLTDAVPESMCGNTSDVIIPTATPSSSSSSPTQTNQTYAFLNADGYVFGGVRNQQWIDPGQASEALSTGQQVSVYTNSALAGSSSITQRTAAGNYDCGSTGQFNLDPNAAWMFSIATNGTWNLTPRRPALMDSTTAPYSTVLMDVLSGLGLDDPRVYFLTLQRVDLEGDGVDEVLMTGFRQQAGSNSTLISSGDYAIVILRRLEGNEVLNIPLVSDVYLQSASNVSAIQYRVIGLLDLNADGILEIIIQGTSPAEMVIMVFDLTEPSYQPVLSLSCTHN